MKITTKEKELLINEMYNKLLEKKFKRGFPVLAATIDEYNHEVIVMQNKQYKQKNINTEKLNQEKNTDINNHAEIILLKHIKENGLKIKFILITLPPCINCYKEISEYISKNKVKIYFLTDPWNKTVIRDYVIKNNINIFNTNDLKNNKTFILQVNFIIMKLIYGLLNHKEYPKGNDKKIISIAKKELKKFKYFIDKLEIKDGEIKDNNLKKMVKNTIKFEIENVTIKNEKIGEKPYWIF